jgi:hypothetical protein
MRIRNRSSAAIYRYRAYPSLLIRLLVELHYAPSRLAADCTDVRTCIQRGAYRMVLLTDSSYSL